MGWCRWLSVERSGKESLPVIAAPQRWSLFCVLGEYTILPSPPLHLRSVKERNQRPSKLDVLPSCLIVSRSAGLSHFRTTIAEPKRNSKNQTVFSCHSMKKGKSSGDNGSEH